jgi:hypothetical protein
LKGFKALPTTLSTSENRSISEGELLRPEDGSGTWYMSIVGALQYVMLTRSCIAFFQSTRYTNIFMPPLLYIGQS